MAFFSKKIDDKKEEKSSEDNNQGADVKADSVKPLVLNLPFVLVQPRISEKAGALAKLNKYVFVVKKKTNKVEVKKAVEREYKVKVVRVNMVNNKGKVKNFGRMVGKTSQIRKAIVTLKQGDVIKGLTDVA